MGSILYSAIICLLLILKIGIKAEPPFSSFINLIPNIISNGKFVQENIINSNIEFNQSLPWINVDLTLNANESNCSQDLLLLARDLVAGRTWALKTLDAWGKFPSGLMQGNIYWIGSVSECRHHLRGLKNSVVDQPFRTRTCVIGNSDSNTMRPIYGVCVPQSCSANDIVDFVNRRTIRIPFIQPWIHLDNDTVHCINDRSLDAKAIITITLLSIIASLILLATGTHLAYRHEYDIKIDDVPSPGYEPIVSQTTTTTTAVTETSISTNTVARTTIDTVLPTNPIDEEDEDTPLISRPRLAENSVAKNLIRSCSLINNYHLLKHQLQPTNLSCLNGIRVLSLWWIILGHTLMFAVSYSDNVMTIFNWSRKLWFQIILQAVFSIDSFFLLSGLLTAFLFFISKIVNEKFSLLKFLLNHYIYRYLRYTIFYAIVLLIYIALSPYFGQRGPIYPDNGSEVLACRQTWWRNLLYINNFFEISDSCIPVTWFLAVNMQLHWIAPLFLLAASWKWFFGMLVSLAFILVDIITTSVIVSQNDYDHGFLSDIYSNKSNWSNRTSGYMNDVYIKPWCRIAPYTIGLTLGYCLYEMYTRANTLTWESILPQRTSRYFRLKQVLAWAVALTILSLCIFGTYGDYSEHELTRAGRITFLTLSRLGWAIGLSIIIVACSVGYGGIANKFLSHSFFHSLSKLTYGAYLWHSLVLFVNYFGREQPTHYTVPNILFNFIIHIIISYVLSFISYLFIELPIIQLLKLAIKRPTIHHL